MKTNKTKFYIWAIRNKETNELIRKTKNANPFFVSLSHAYLRLKELDSEKYELIEYNVHESKSNSQINKYLKKKGKDYEQR